MEIVCSPCGYASSLQVLQLKWRFQIGFKGECFLRSHVIDQQPLQDIPCLSPYHSWDSLYTLPFVLHCHLMNWLQWKFIHLWSPEVQYYCSSASFTLDFDLVLVVLTLFCQATKVWIYHTLFLLMNKQITCPWNTVYCGLHQPHCQKVSINSLLSVASAANPVATDDDDP